MSKQVLKIPIDDIKFVKELYPRFEMDDFTVNQYRNAIDNLPKPLVTHETYTLVDGLHTITTYRLEGRKEIEVEIFLSEDPLEILKEAIRRNSIHGKQLTSEEKRECARALYKQGIKDVDEIADILSVHPSTIRNWTKKLREDATDRRNAEILDLYLQCFTYDEIAEKLGITKGTITNLFKNEELLKIKQPETLIRYNVWKVKQLSLNQMKYPGRARAPPSS